LDIKAATHAISVVAAAADPVAHGIVPSLARPGGNITGVTSDSGVEMWGKRLELLREMVPGASRVGYLASPRVWEAPTIAVLREAAQRMKISLIGPPLGAPSGEAEYRRVITAMAQAGAEAVILSDQPEHDANSQLIVELTAEARLPTLYAYRSYAG